MSECEDANIRETRNCPPVEKDSSRVLGWNWNEDLPCDEPLIPVAQQEVVEAPLCDLDPALSPEEYLARTIKGYFPSSMLMDEEAEGFATLVSGMTANALATAYSLNPTDQVSYDSANPNLLLYIAANLGLELENFLFNTTDKNKIAASWREQIRTATFRFKRKGTQSGMNQALHILDAGLYWDVLYETLEKNEETGTYHLVLRPYSELIEEIGGAPISSSPCAPSGLASFFPLNFSTFKAFVEDRSAPCGELGPGGGNGYSSYSLLPPAPEVEGIANVVTSKPRARVLAISADRTLITISAKDYVALGSFLNGPILLVDSTNSFVVTPIDVFGAEGLPDSACDVTDSSLTVQLLLDSPVNSALGLSSLVYLVVPTLSDGFLVKDTDTNFFYTYDLSTNSFALVAQTPEELCELNLSDANYAQTAQANIEIVFTKNSILFNAETNAIDLALKLVSKAKPFHLTTNKHTVTFQLEDILNLRECVEAYPLVECYDVLWKPSCCRYHFEVDSQVHTADASTCDDSFTLDPQVIEEEFTVPVGGTVADTLANTPDVGTIQLFAVHADGTIQSVAFDDGAGDVGSSPFISGADTDFSDATFDITISSLVADGGTLRVRYQIAGVPSGAPDRSFSLDGCTPCDLDINEGICWEECGVPVLSLGSGCAADCCEAVAIFPDGDCCKFFGSSKWGCDIGVFGEPHNCFDNCPDDNTQTVYVGRTAAPAASNEFPALNHNFAVGDFVDPVRLAIVSASVVVENSVTTFVQGVDYTVSGNTITSISPALDLAGSVAVSYTNKPKWVNTVGGDPAPDDGQIDTLLWDTGTLTLVQHPLEEKRLHWAACKTPPEQHSPAFMCA